MDYIPPKLNQKVKAEEQEFIVKELLFRLLAGFIPEEVLRDGLNPKTKAMLFDLMAATIVMMIIVIPGRCCF